MSIVMTVGPGCALLGCTLDDLMSFCLAEFDWSQISGVVCGLEPGWDHAMALTAQSIGVPVHVVFPYMEWEKKWSKTIQKKCLEILEESGTWTVMGSDHNERPSDLHMASISDEVLAMAPPGWSNGRLSVVTLKQLPYRNAWTSWQELYG